MRGKKAVFIALIMLVTLLQPVLAIDDYGEDEAYLGQVVDDYENDDNVASAYNIINNVILDCMELNLTVGIDFLDYTEIDGANDITVSNEKIEWSSMRRDADAYVYYDYGVDSFDDFQHNFTLIISGVWSVTSSSRDLMDVYRIGNGYGSMTDYPGISNNYLRLLVKENGANEDKFELRFHQVTGGVTDFIDISAIYNIRMLYITVERIGVNLNCRLYSDLSRTVLLETLTSGVSGSGLDYRYIQPVTSREQFTDPADHSTGYIEWEFGTGYVDGHYYTVEMLAGNRSLALLYNASIPGGTGMTMEFSSDNTTWVDHNKAPGSDTLINGFESLDQRDLNFTVLYTRVNMTSTGENTPRIYQFRLVTITDVIIPESPALVAMGKYYAMAIILLILGVLIGIGMRGKR